MKKAIALCLTAAMAASLLTGCGSKTTETTAAAENKTETTAGAAAEEKTDEAAGVVKVINMILQMSSMHSAWIKTSRSCLSR